MSGRLMVLLVAVWVVLAAALIYVDGTDRFLPIRMLLPWLVCSVRLYCLPQGRQNQSFAFPNESIAMSLPTP